MMQVLRSDDLKPCFGKWKGSLTYLDYSSGKAFSLEALVTIGKLSHNDSAITITFDYPNEPKANKTDTLTITKRGQFFDGARILQLKTEANKDFEIVTEYSGPDGNDNKMAVIRKTYTLQGSSFTIRKDVQFTGKTEWINRHHYDFVRI